MKTLKRCYSSHAGRRTCPRRLRDVHSQAVCPRGGQSVAPSSRKRSVALVFTFFTCSTFVACSGASEAPSASLDGRSSSGLCGDSWSLTGSMAQGRYDATATRLADGSVLAAGGMWDDGLGNSGFATGAERFHPSTNTWSAAGNLNVPRYFHRAVRLQDGRVFV